MNIFLILLLLLLLLLLLHVYQSQIQKRHPEGRLIFTLLMRVAMKIFLICFVEV